VIKQPGCALCDAVGGPLIFQGPKFRIVRAGEAAFPAFYRLVWIDHVAEISELSPADRHLCMDAVAQVEQLLREQLRPAKVNLAALGNVVPHLHWHVIARFGWDSHFPGAVWGAALRHAPREALASIEALLPALEAEMARLLARTAEP
jgi:diadenosine tetraphosphate (Ap4A) HIT family hydrolase